MNSYDVVGLMDFLHGLTGKLAEMSNSELVFLFVALTVIVEGGRNSRWFKRILKQVGYLDE